MTTATIETIFLKNRFLSPTTCLAAAAPQQQRRRRAAPFIMLLRVSVVVVVVVVLVFFPQKNEVNILFLFEYIYFGRSNDKYI